MNLEKIRFYSMLGIIWVLPIGSVYGKTCSLGEYLMTRACYECPPGCYCTNSSTKVDPKDKFEHEEITRWCAGEINSCSHQGQDGYGACGHPDGGVHKCPDDFPNSMARTTTAGDCYALVGSKKIFYKKITCASNRYLPMNSDQCAPCPSNAECPGVKNVYPSTTENQGITEIDPNNIIVKPGQFLPAGSVKPIECVGQNKHKHCPGGIFTKSNKEQGRYDCPRGGKVNKDLASCNITLNKEQLQKGLNGNSRCWTYLDSADYLNCLGVDIADETQNETSDVNFGGNLINIESNRIDILKNSAKKIKKDLFGS